MTVVPPPATDEQPAMFAPRRRRKANMLETNAEAPLRLPQLPAAAARGGQASTSHEKPPPPPRARTPTSFKDLGVSDWLCR